MPDPVPGPQINVSKITVNGGAIGAFITAVCMAIFLIGIPMLRVMFPVALVCGVFVAGLLRAIRPHPPRSLGLK